MFYKKFLSGVFLFIGVQQIAIHALEQDDTHKTTKITKKSKNENLKIGYKQKEDDRKYNNSLNHKDNKKHCQKRKRLDSDSDDDSDWKNNRNERYFSYNKDDKRNDSDKESDDDENKEKNYYPQKYPKKNYAQVIYSHRATEKNPVKVIIHSDNVNSVIFLNKVSTIKIFAATNGTKQ